MNQAKINLAIDERLDRIDAFYKKRMDDLSSKINDRLDKLQDNNIYLDKKIRELDGLSTKLCYKLDKVDKRLDELEAQERAVTKIMEITADEIQELQEADSSSKALYIAEQMLIDENNRLNKESK